MAEKIEPFKFTPHGGCAGHSMVRMLYTRD